MSITKTEYPGGDLTAAEPVRSMTVALGRGPEGWVITLRINDGVNYAFDGGAMLSLMDAVGSHIERMEDAPAEHLDRVLAEAYEAVVIPPPPEEPVH